MYQQVEIEISYKGEAHSYYATLVPAGQYGYRFTVVVNGKDITFEPDEERGFRAIIDPSAADTLTAEDREVVRLISEKLEQATKE